MCFRLLIMSGGDRLKSRGQCSKRRRTAEEIRAETERMKVILAQLERENEIYEANCWKLEVGTEAQERARNVPLHKKGA